MLIHKKTELKDVQRLADDLHLSIEKQNHLMKLIHSSDRQISMRASWALLHFSFKFPEEVKRFIPELLDYINKPNIPTGSIRNCIRIFTVSEIEDKYIANIYDTCLKMLMNIQMPTAVRAFSIQTNLLICKRYPELGNELNTILKNITEEEDLPPSLNVWMKRANDWFQKSLTQKKSKQG